MCVCACVCIVSFSFSVLDALEMTTATATAPKQPLPIKRRASFPETSSSFFDGDDPFGDLTDERSVVSDDYFHSSLVLRNNHNSINSFNSPRRLEFIVNNQSHSSSDECDTFGSLEWDPDADGDNINGTEGASRTAPSKSDGALPVTSALPPPPPPPLDSGDQASVNGFVTEEDSICTEQDDYREYETKLEDEVATVATTASTDPSSANGKLTSPRVMGMGMKKALLMSPAAAAAASDKHSKAFNKALGRVESVSTSSSGSVLSHHLEYHTGADDVFDITKNNNNSFRRPNKPRNSCNLSFHSDSSDLMNSHELGNHLANNMNFLAAATPSTSNRKTKVSPAILDFTSSFLEDDAISPHPSFDKWQNGLTSTTRKSQIYSDATTAIGASKQSQQQQQLQLQLQQHKQQQQQQQQQLQQQQQSQEVQQHPSVARQISLQVPTRHESYRGVRSTTSLDENSERHNDKTSKQRMDQSHSKTSNRLGNDEPSSSERLPPQSYAAPYGGWYASADPSTMQRQFQSPFVGGWYNSDPPTSGRNPQAAPYGGWYGHEYSSRNQPDPQRSPQESQKKVQSDPSEMEPKVDPRMIDPRMIDPRMVDPRMIDPRMVSPRMIDPRMVDPRMVDPRMVDPRMMDPRYAGYAYPIPMGWGYPPAYAAPYAFAYPMTAAASAYPGIEANRSKHPPGTSQEGRIDAGASTDLNSKNSVDSSPTPYDQKPLPFGPPQAPFALPPFGGGAPIPPYVYPQMYDPYGRTVPIPPFMGYPPMMHHSGIPLPSPPHPPVRESNKRPLFGLNTKNLSPDPKARLHTGAVAAVDWLD